MTASVEGVRVERVRPRRAVRRHDQLPTPVRQPAAVLAADGEIVLLDLVDTTASSPLVARWVAIRYRWDRAREVWRQTTFYLFDADSWRR